jgi:hypothetical protein
LNTAVFLLTLLSLTGGSPTHRVPRGANSIRARAIQPRVWSNDDVKNLRENVPISVVGTATPALHVPEAKAFPPCEGPYVKEADPAWYSEEIESRREQLAQVNWQLAHIAAVEAGGQGISNAFPLVGTNPGILLPGTTFSLEQEKEALRLEITNLQDLAQEREIPRAAWR